MKSKLTAIIRMFRLLTIVAILLPLAGLAQAAPAAPDATGDVWRTYTNANWVNDVAVEGNVFWAATDGGLVRWYREPVNYRKYLTTDGLPSSQINAVAVDGNGTKWIGTSRGLVRYDNLSFTTYNVSNSGLVNNNVYAIEIEGNGDIWIGTGGGVSRLSGTSWTSYTTSNSGLVSNSVISLAIEGSVKWFGTWGSGISRFDGANWTTYTPGSGSIRNTINAIAIDPGGVKWFGAGNQMGASGGGGGGLYSFDNTNWTTYTDINSGLASDYVFSLAVDNSGAKWIGTEYGLNRFDGITWTTYTQADGLAYDWVAALAQASGEIWAGTNGGGISLFSGATWRTYRTTDQLPHNSLTGMGVQGNSLWVSGSDLYVITDFNGASRYNGVSWTHFRYGESDISMPEVYEFEAEPGGLLWVVGWDINTFDGVNWDLVTDPYGVGKVQLVAIDGNVKWFYSYEPFGSAKWVSRYDGVNWTAYTSVEIGLSLNQVRMLAVDENHNLWLSTSNGVARYDGMAWTTLTISNSGLASNNVYDIEIDPDGSIWFTTNSGVSHLSGSNWVTFNTSNSGLASNMVYAMAIDRYGRKWFATNSGVSVYDGFSWTTYNRSNSGLADNVVYNVVITTNDHKWFNTASGLSELYRRPRIVFNYSSGAPSSYFNLVGSDFPPLTGASLTVNGQGIGGVMTNASGVFTATITTSAADEGWYYLTARVEPTGLLAPLENPDLQATGLFSLDPAGAVHPKEGSYTEYAVPAGSAVTDPMFLPILSR